MELKENIREYKMYVGNLEYSVNETDLEQFIQQKGINVKNVRIVKDRITGRSKGFGFAEVNTEEELNTAISTLDGQELKGRKMRVDKARQRRFQSSFRRRQRFPGSRQHR